MCFLTCCCGSRLEHVFFRQKGTLIWGSFWEPLLRSILNPFWPQTDTKTSLSESIYDIFCLSADLSGQRPHRTFQVKSPTGRFGGTAPQDVSANIYRKLRKYPETLRELDLTISLHRAPGNQGNRRSRASVYNNIKYYKIQLNTIIYYTNTIKYYKTIYNHRTARRLLSPKRRAYTRAEPLNPSEIATLQKTQ